MLLSLIVRRYIAATATAKSLQSCLTLCDPIDGSPPGSSVHGIFQSRVLEWGAIAFSKASAYYLLKRYASFMASTLDLMSLLCRCLHYHLINIP